MSRRDVQQMVGAMRRRAREDWNIALVQALDEIRSQGQDLGAALGEISRDEAVSALKHTAAVALERLR